MVYKIAFNSLCFILMKIIHTKTKYGDRKKFIKMLV